MTIKDLVSDYKGSIEISVKKMEEDEAVEIVSFDATEKDAIKDEIMNAEVSKWNVVVGGRVTPNTTISILIKSATTTDTSDPTDPPSDPGNSDPSGDPTP